jgi:hypothetical protein
VSKAEAQEHFSLGPAKWAQRFGPASKARKGTTAPRQPVLDVLDLVLSVHGSSAEAESQQQRRRKKRPTAGAQREAAAFKAVEAALKAAKISVTFATTGLSFKSGRMSWKWTRWDGWQWRYIRLGGQVASEPHLHAVMRVLKAQ